MTPWMFGMNNYSTSIWLPVPQGIPFYEKTILINWKLDSEIKSLQSVILKMKRFLSMLFWYTYYLGYKNMLDIHIREKAAFFCKKYP